MELNQADIERLVMLLVSGFTVDKAVEYCKTHFGLSTEEAEEAVGDARKKLTLAADFVRDEQLGTAIARLNSLYVKAIGEADIKTALQAQRELNKLMGLYKAESDRGGEDGEGSLYREKLELIQQYILPLGLVDERYPIEEHVRVAAEIVREQKYNTNLSER